MVLLPALQDALGEEQQATNLGLAEALGAAWRQTGGRPTSARGGRRELSRFQRQAAVAGVPWEALQRAGAFITVEIQNNSPRTPAERQLLLMDTAIWRSIAYMLGER